MEQYILFPLTGEKWQNQSFGNHVGLSTERFDGANLEWSIVLKVMNPQKAKVKAYYLIREKADKAVYDLFYERTFEELTDERKMKPVLYKQVEELERKLSNQEIKVEILFHFSPGIPREEKLATSRGEKGEGEIRLFPKATEEDYQSLRKLMDNYQTKSLAEFNQSVSNWAEENWERSERINQDVVWNDIPVDLTEEEKEFVRFTFFYSGQEIAEKNRSRYTKSDPQPLILSIDLPQRQDTGKQVSCQLSYDFSYQILKDKKITVDERDRVLKGVLNEIEKKWNEIPFEILMSSKRKQRMEAILSKTIIKYSNDKVKLNLESQVVQFEDERMYRN